LWQWMKCRGSEQKANVLTYVRFCNYLRIQSSSMAKLNIDGQTVISYEFEGFQHHWKAMTDHIIAKHGEKEFTDHVEVQEILSDCLEYMGERLLQSIHAETSLSFFLYVHWLHQETQVLNHKFRGGMEPEEFPSPELAGYRRILKLVLETGCDIDLTDGAFPDQSEIARIDIKMQEVLYFARWLYWFAEQEAIHNMVADSKCITFADGQLEVGWQFHFGAVYENILPMIKNDYAYAMFDEDATPELLASLEKCFKLKLQDAFGVIQNLQSKRNRFTPELTAVEYDLLPKNLKSIAGISTQYAESFYGGLSLTRANKKTLIRTVRKPYQMDRYLFRPILVYKVSNINKVVVSKAKIQESLVIIATNAIHWTELTSEWKKNPCMLGFIQKKAAEHDKLLEDRIEEIVADVPYLLCRNITKLRDGNGQFVDFEADCGEIDFIVVNEQTQTIFVTDAKYNRARYDAVGFRNEYSTFKDEYEPKLRKKLDWISRHKELLVAHLNHKYGRNDIDLTNFSIDAAFLINTPTFYMFNGKFKAIPLYQLDLYFGGTFGYPIFKIDKEDGSQQIAQHPYFVKPITLNL
jgi:hypothetical protein